MGGRRKADRLFWLVFALAGSMTAANIYSLYRFNTNMGNLERAAKRLYLICNQEEPVDTRQEPSFYR